MDCCCSCIRLSSGGGSLAYQPRTLHGRKMPAHLAYLGGLYGLLFHCLPRHWGFYMGLCSGFTHTFSAVQNSETPDPLLDLIMHNHHWKDLLAEATAPACPGLVVGSPAHGTSPPMAARIGRSPMIPSGSGDCPPVLHPARRVQCLRGWVLRVRRCALRQA